MFGAILTAVVHASTKRHSVLDTFQIFLTGTNNCEISHLSVGRVVRIGCAYILL